MKNARCLFSATLLLLAAPFAGGYPIGPAVGLDDLVKQADVIFQGTVVSNKTITDAAFQAIMGFIVQETEFQPAYAIKGKSSTSVIKFRHYGLDSNAGGMIYQPQSCAFEIGKSYLVFAKQPSGNAASTCQQIWMSHTGMMDEGVLLCFRPEPFGRRSIKDLFWRDLTELLRSPDPKDVVYAITHLDDFSGSTDPTRQFGALSEFQHLDVLATVHGLVASSDPTVAQAALTVVGTHNPYMTRERAQFWLATVGSEDTHGLAKMDPHMINEGGLIYWREIAAVVDGAGDDKAAAVFETVSSSMPDVLR